MSDSVQADICTVATGAVVIAGEVGGDGGSGRRRRNLQDRKWVLMTRGEEGTEYMVIRMCATEFVGPFTCRPHLHSEQSDIGQRRHQTHATAARGRSDGPVLRLAEGSAGGLQIVGLQCPNAGVGWYLSALLGLFSRNSAPEPLNPRRESRLIKAWRLDVFQDGVAASNCRKRNGTVHRPFQTTISIPRLPEVHPHGDAFLSLSPNSRNVASSLILTQLSPPTARPDWPCTPPLRMAPSHAATTLLQEPLPSLVADPQGSVGAGAGAGTGSSISMTGSIDPNQDSTPPSVAPSSGGALLEDDAPLSPADTADGANRRPGKRPAARGTAFYPRKRANTACQVCRARKTKCDNKKPACSYCVSVGATCIQSPVDLSSFDPASLKILDRLDELERLLRQASATGDSASTPVSTSGPALASPMTEISSHRGVINQQRLPPLAQPLPAIHQVHSSINFGRDIPTRDEDRVEINSVLPQRVDHILQWPAFQNSFANLSPSSCRAPPDAISTPAAGSASLAGLVDMESHRIYRLLDNFFLHIHCKNPILDEASARRMVLNAFLDGIDWSPASCLAMIICALGCIATPFGPSGETKLGTPAYNDSRVFFQAAQKRIGILLVRSDIVGAQCLFLSGVYLMMVFQPIYAWRFFSQALAACQHFPFLARAQVVSTSPDSLEMGRQDTQEQAVYWSAWKSERELRYELDLPDFDILNSGSTLYPPFFPAPPVPPTDSPDGPDSETQRARASWLFYLAEISLRRLTSRLSSEVLALRQRYAANSQFLDVLSDMMPEYEAQIREWSDSLPAELSIHTPIEEDGICRSVLRGRMINLFEQLYWPFVMAYINANATRRGVKPAVVEFARKGLDMHIHQIQANKPGFHHRHHGGTFMIRACTRSALVMLAAAKSGCLMPSNWDDFVYKIVGMLAYWEDEDRDLVNWRTTLERELAVARIS